MNDKNAFFELKTLLAGHNQAHLLAFWDELTPARKQGLRKQIESLDLATIDGWVAELVKGSTTRTPTENLAPAPFYPAHPPNATVKRKHTEAVRLGKELISAGKVAALVVAGGQGTRLGFDGPKGDFPISPVRNKTFFRMFAETIAAAAARYRATCPWYIMTSPLNHGQTLAIFEKNGHFGLDPDDVFIFRQGTLPNFAFDGRMLLADKYTIASSPDGHGGCLTALHKSGALADMKRRGIEHISYWQIDNPLVNVFDPLFIGLHALDQAEMSSKAVIKNDPFEKVGNFYLCDGKVTVIEYSDLPKELADARRPDPEGSRRAFELGSIAIHIISTSFVERLSSRGISLPLHRAVKKVACIDEQGCAIDPVESNGIKLESFIFDALPLASRSVILETIRSEEFAPTKNATGPDSVETTRAMMVARAAGWLESADIVVPRKPDGSPNCLLEIAPSFALYKEDLRSLLARIPPIKHGASIYLE
jgi:UDP-N-acetylglucosamine/UDP-N-acetylgalactosamine diphosphorylase